MADNEQVFRIVVDYKTAYEELERVKEKLKAAQTVQTGGYFRARVSIGIGSTQTKAHRQPERGYRFDRRAQKSYADRKKYGFGRNGRG